MILQRMKALSRRWLGTFGSFTAGQKAATICTVLGLAVGGFFYSQWASAVSYAPLYTNLSAADANAMVTKLTSSGVSYKLADGGQTIMVPQNKVYDLRLTMSGQGLPAGKDTGYALLDKQGVTTSEFMQHVDYQRALEGELNKTIGSIDGVQSATVHLAIPQKDVFTDDTQKPTASVLVATAPGQDLSTNQVQAITHLVSSSVVGLDTNQVTVANAAGEVLSASGVDGDISGAATGQAQQTIQYEQRMASSLQQMLDQVVGPGHSKVKVTADLNYDQTATKSQTYVANSKNPPLSQTTNQENYTGTGSSAGGVLGADNIQVPSGSGPGTYTHRSSTQDNALGTVTQTVQTAPGSVRKLSVAVLLDSRTAANINTNSVQQLVSNAVGLSTARGDTMAVTSLPFDQTAVIAAKQAQVTTAKAQWQQQVMSAVKDVAIGFAVLLLLLKAMRGRRKAKKRMKLTAEEQARLDEMQAALEAQRREAITAREAQLAIDAGGGPESSEGKDRDRRQKELGLLVDRQPEEVAQLLRTWLADSRG